MTPHHISDTLSAKHGFFGRQGGVSKGVYDSLNAGERSDDTLDHVAENRARIAQAMGVAPTHLVSLHQIHSDIVEIITEPPTEPLQADGLVTTVKGLAISALSADCGPVLLSDPKAGVIGACHAGWRGALGGIVESTVAAMCEVGATPADITAILGPCIGPKNYEVGEEFRAEFLEMNEDYEQFFHTPSGAKAHFDLPAFILSRLDVMGVSATWTKHCTYTEADTYFSYRRNTHENITGYGRNLSAVVML